MNWEKQWIFRDGGVDEVWWNDNIQLINSLVERIFIEDTMLTQSP